MIAPTNVPNYYDYFDYYDQTATSHANGVTVTCYYIHGTKTRSQADICLRISQKAPDMACVARKCPEDSQDMVENFNVLKRLSEAI